MRPYVSSSAEMPLACLAMKMHVHGVHTVVKNQTPELSDMEAEPLWCALLLAHHLLHVSILGYG